MHRKMAEFPQLGTTVPQKVVPMVEVTRRRMAADHQQRQIEGMKWKAVLPRQTGRKKEHLHK